jgi:hypothetical protein
MIAQRNIHKSESRRMLLCGLHAVNHALHHMGRDTLSRDRIDEINAEFAQVEEGVAYDDRRHVAFTHPLGWYPVEALLHTLTVYGDCSHQRWTPDSAIDGEVYLVGCGNHWTTCVKKKNGEWLLKDGKTVKPIFNITPFLTGKHLNGAVYCITFQNRTEVEEVMNVDAPVSNNGDEALSLDVLASPESMQVSPPETSHPADDQSQSRNINQEDPLHNNLPINTTASHPSTSSQPLSPSSLHSSQSTIDNLHALQARVNVKSMEARANSEKNVEKFHKRGKERRDNLISKARRNEAKQNERSENIQNRHSSIKHSEFHIGTQNKEARSSNVQRRLNFPGGEPIRNDKKASQFPFHPPLHSASIGIGLLPQGSLEASNNPSSPTSSPKRTREEFDVDRNAVWRSPSPCRSNREDIDSDSPSSSKP